MDGGYHVYPDQGRIPISVVDNGSVVAKNSWVVFVVQFGDGRQFEGP